MVPFGGLQVNMPASKDAAIAYLGSGRQSKLTPAERQQTWSRLEEDLVEMFSKLSDTERVVAVEQLKINHTTHTLTTHGEVAATATAEVVTFF